MIKKLIRHGNSLALVLDKPILELLSIKAETRLEVATDGRNLVVSPLKDAKSSRHLDDWMKAADRKYDKTFRRLAGA
jgi:antitoxin MazE